MLKINKDFKPLPMHEVLEQDILDLQQMVDNVQTTLDKMRIMLNQMQNELKDTTTP